MPYNLEVERKYKCFPDKVPLDKAVNVNNIRQFYLAAAAWFESRNHFPPEIRVVIRNDHKAEITIKSSDNCEIRDEFSIPISLDDANKLEKLKVGNTILKDRYYIPMTLGECLQLKGKAVWEVDVYKGQEAGLVTAEVEFPPEVYNNTICVKLPDWIEKDVTDNPTFKNAQIALRSYMGKVKAAEDLQKWIEEENESGNP